MANVHTVSSQESASQLNDSDLFFVSQSQNQYNSAWKSRKIDAKTLGEGIERQFRDDNFSEELDDLQEVYDTYLNVGNLKINYDGPNNKIQLLSAGMMFSEFDSSQFVTQGMIENAYIKDGKLVIIFNLASGGTKKVEIDLGSLIDTYYAGNGLCCDDHTFYIDEDIVSTVGHHHVSADIDDLSDTLAPYEKISNLKSAAYCLSTDFSLSTHDHKISQIKETAYAAIEEKSDTTLPTAISFKKDSPILMFNSTSQTTLALNNFSSDATEVGCYTWELMIASNANITSFSSTAEYVGRDYESLIESLKLKDNVSTIHVFSVRQIKLASKSYWQINYAYSFKK